MDQAREKYAELVERHQRRAIRIAFHYMREAADAEEAVQDAFVKAYTHMGTFRDCLLYTSPSPRDRTRYRMPSSA